MWKVFILVTALTSCAAQPTYHWHHGSCDFYNSHTGAHHHYDFFTESDCRWQFEFETR